MINHESKVLVGDIWTGDVLEYTVLYVSNNEHRDVLLYRDNGEVVGAILVPFSELLKIAKLLSRQEPVDKCEECINKRYIFKDYKYHKIKNNFCPKCGDKIDEVEK